MKFLKNNLKVIIAFIVGIILASSITVYAYSYAAKDVSYTKPGENAPIDVERALNDLYANKNLATEPFTWLNTNHNLSCYAGTIISCDMSKYSKAIIFCEYDNSNTYTGLTTVREFNIVIGETINITGNNTNAQLTYTFPMTFKTNGIELGQCRYSGAASGNGGGHIDGIILY